MLYQGTWAHTGFEQANCPIAFPLPTPHGETHLLKVQCSSKGCSRFYLLCPVVNEHQFNSRTNISHKIVPQIHTGYFWNCIKLLLLSWCGSSTAYIPDYICSFPKVKHSFPEVFINSLYYLHNWMAAFNCDEFRVTVHLGIKKMLPLPVCLRGEIRRESWSWFPYVMKMHGIILNRTEHLLTVGW